MGLAVIKLTIIISDKDQLSAVIKKLKRLSGVLEINRTNRKAGKK